MFFHYYNKSGPSKYQPVKYLPKSQHFSLSKGIHSLHMETKTTVPCLHTLSYLPLSSFITCSTFDVLLCLLFVLNSWCKRALLCPVWQRGCHAPLIQTPNHCRFGLWHSFNSWRSFNYSFSVHLVGVRSTRALKPFEPIKLVLSGACKSTPSCSAGTVLHCFALPVTNCLSADHVNRAAA